MKFIYICYLYLYGISLKDKNSMCPKNLENSQIFVDPRGDTRGDGKKMFFMWPSLLNVICTLLSLS